MMQRFSRAILKGVAASLPVASPALAESDALRKAGDVLQIALPVAGWGMTYYYDDKEGRIQLYKSGAANMTTVFVMKEGIGKLRPDASAPTSYPSGHTNGAFFGAAFINTRYGRTWGIPAYALAVLTGYSRVEADAHFADDVVAGASIAVLWNWAFVTPMPKGVAMGPMRVANGYGIGLTLSDAGQQEAPRKPVATGPTRFRFEYAYTPAYLRGNLVRSPSASGTEFDLDDFDNIEEPTPATVSEFEWRLNERHSLTFQVALFEARDNETLSQSTSFGGTTFAAGAAVRSAYRSYSMPIIYRYDLAPDSRWIARVGATLVPLFTSVELSDGTNDVKVDETSTALMPNLMVGARLGRDFRLTADVTGISSGGDTQFEAGVRLTYELSREWEMGVGYRRYEFTQDATELYNDVEYEALQFSVAHLW